MLDVSVIILTYNEEIHIRRCLDNIKDLARDIYIIDSFSTDRTLDIVKEYKEYNVMILQNKWENNYAKQFNWALEHAPIRTAWVLRLDADEYLLPALQDELIKKIPFLLDSVSGIVFKRRHYFLGKWMKRGIYPVYLLRMFRYGKAVCEQRLMDEHIQLLDGTSVNCEGDFVDHNLNNLSWFCNKHVNYAVREAADLLDIEFDLYGVSQSDDQKKLTAQAIEKRRIKHRYVRMPLFWRSFFYFCYRYFFKGGFLEGKEGFLWNFLQGWWYRTLVDAKVFEIKRACGTDKEKIKRYLSEVYNCRQV
ncbi:glycosyltransferase family 2 protein [Parabacteroides sp. TM07-1AC]|uniref:glycosyltransferase family 2 protein n=1 Tax=Parabacteroides sp. TM07-1AC TaxID=2292363 RepID=UPI000F00F93B|nr:glycosyltransferase family 2 protein [Parabacteroides sp. TM07-1AC]RHU24723.1 glycosyltransferase family 2 protein [Parabacteroides sp. TM07-1AC]